MGAAYSTLRYVERNPLRANMVEEADAWRWSSLWHRRHGNKAGFLDAGPIGLPRRWLQCVQRPQTETELEALERSMVRDGAHGLRNFVVSFVVSFVDKVPDKARDKVASGN